MKEEDKKIIIRIMNIVALIGNTISLVLINIINFLSNYIEELSEISNKFQNGKISILQQSIILSLCILFSIVNLILSRNIKKNEGKISFLMAISMMFGSFYNIIAGYVSLIAIYKNKKGEKIEENIKLENVKSFNKWIYLIMFIIVFIIFYTSIIVNQLPNINVFVMAIIIYLGRIIAVVIPFFKILKRDIKEFFKNKKKYIKEIIKTFSITMLVFLPASIVVSAITGSQSTNQNLIKEIPLWITAILAVGVAPISEEILFRGFLRRIFKKDWIFIATSGIIFGVIHCLYAEENWLMYLFILPYAVMGIGFAKLYAKTNNIIANIILHFIWNLIVIGAMCILSI